MENKNFQNRVFGCAIIKSVNANYNADFTKQPRTLPNGLVYATDKALKFTVRNYLVKNYSEDKILYFTRNKINSEKGSMVPMSLREVFENIFENPLPRVRSTGGKKPMIYFFNGKEIEVKCQQVTENNLKKFFKSFEDTPEGVTEFLKIGKKAAIKEIEKIELTDDEKAEPFYFFIDKSSANKVTKIDLEEEVIDERITDIDLHFFGGYNKIKILYNLLNCLDVRLFGATYTGDTNVSIHGPVQINHAIDRFIYENRQVENLSYSEQIKAPFRNAKAKGGDAEMTTIGSQTKSMEAHYVHHFSVNPKNLNDHVRDANEIATKKGDENANRTETPLIGLSNEDIKKLKEGLRVGVSYYDSSAKAGTENELLIWVQLNEGDGSKLVLPNFTELISITKNNGKTKIDLQKLKGLLEKEYVKSAVEKIELFYNDSVTEVINEPTAAIKIEIADLSKPENSKSNEE